MKHYCQKMSAEVELKVVLEVEVKLVKPISNDLF